MQRGGPDTPVDLPRGARMALLGPDALCKAVAAVEEDPERRWMLTRPRAVRASFVAEVLDGAGDQRAMERWLLLQDEDVRRSYVEEVLDRA